MSNVVSNNVWLLTYLHTYGCDTYLKENQAEFALCDWCVFRGHNKLFCVIWALLVCLGEMHQCVWFNGNHGTPIGLSEMDYLQSCDILAGVGFLDWTWLLQKRSYKCPFLDGCRVYHQAFGSSQRVMLALVVMLSMWVYQDVSDADPELTLPCQLPGGHGHTVSTSGQGGVGFIFLALAVIKVKTECFSEGITKQYANFCWTLPLWKQQMNTDSYSPQNWWKRWKSLLACVTSWDICNPFS